LPGPNPSAESEGPLLTVEEITERLQRLCDRARRDRGLPLKLHVEGWLLGDTSVIAAAALRSAPVVRR
jgi:hypothetical protein